MAGNSSGGKKNVETRVEKYMSRGYSEIEARKMVSDDYRRIGTKGGKNGNKAANPNYGGGFASKSIGDDGLTGYERARVAGAIGGRKSRRHKKVNNG